MELEEFMQGLINRNPDEPEFHQAVREVAHDLIPFINERPKFAEARILERLTEPDRIVTFRVVWEDDEHNVRVNRGHRVQFNKAIGPYKGGLRFDPSVTVNILKFLGFEQTFKNSLTGLPMGSAKGGANFNPRGKSDREVMRFCQAYMTELARHIGENTDIPAGDIGVGAREIGYLFGQYKRMQNLFTGVMTGKGLDYGGSEIRTEATGYGCVYFAAEMLAHAGDSLEGKRCLVSGSGNVAQYAARKLVDLDAQVVTLSDRAGVLFAPDGLSCEQLTEVTRYKTDEHRSLEEFAEDQGLEFHRGGKAWDFAGQLAFPCATQNELDADDVRKLADNGCRLVCEGANMPTTADAIELIHEHGLLYGPGKAANAGGVAVSGLEMSQNSMRYFLGREAIDERLQEIMKNIHRRCVEFGAEEGRVNYSKGANLAGFIKVANAMLAYGVV
jgi:glutamate dehydrogenase (NADP+)